MNKFEASISTFHPLKLPDDDKLEIVHTIQSDDWAIKSDISLEQVYATCGSCIPVFGLLGSLFVGRGDQDFYTPVRVGCSLYPNTTHIVAEKPKKRNFDVRCPLIEQGLVVRRGQQ